MQLTRRGFLSTLAAATAGAAVFDPKKLLWVPGAPSAPVALVTEAAAPVLIEQQLELNALALAFAQQMTERLARHPSVALREVMFRHAGIIKIPAGSLVLDDLAQGKFDPLGRRIMPHGALSLKAGAATQKQFLDDMGRLMSSEIHRAGQAIDMFAPVGTELRPGVSFSADVNIGTATDPQSGLSVRAIRFEHDCGRRLETRVGFEMAGGRWIDYAELTRDALRKQTAIQAIKEHKLSRWERYEWLDEHGYADLLDDHDVLATNEEED